jgi:hypothetical protein
MSKPLPEWHRRPRPSVPSFLASLRRRSLYTPLMEMREEAESHPSGWQRLQYEREPSAFERLSGATTYSPWEEIHCHLGAEDA